MYVLKLPLWPLTTTATTGTEEQEWLCSLDPNPGCKQQIKESHKWHHSAADRSKLLSTRSHLQRLTHSCYLITALRHPSVKPLKRSYSYWVRMKVLTAANCHCSLTSARAHWLWLLPPPTHLTSSRCIRADCRPHQLASSAHRESQAHHRELNQRLW